MHYVMYLLVDIVTYDNASSVIGHYVQNNGSEHVTVLLGDVCAWEPFISSEDWYLTTT